MGVRVFLGLCVVIILPGHHIGSFGVMGMMPMGVMVVLVGLVCPGLATQRQRHEHHGQQ